MEPELLKIAEGIAGEPEPEMVRCHCNNGRWETECCNGAYGCSCRGQTVDMGICNVCNGEGWHAPDANTRANADYIRNSGMMFVGSGPTQPGSVFGYGKYGSGL